MPIRSSTVLFFLYIFLFCFLSYSILVESAKIKIPRVRSVRYNNGYKYFARSEKKERTFNTIYDTIGFFANKIENSDWKSRLALVKYFQIAVRLTNIA